MQLCIIMSMIPFGHRVETISIDNDNKVMPALKRRQPID
jgi:hypothetical protein